MAFRLPFQFLRLVPGFSSSGLTVQSSCRCLKKGEGKKNPGQELFLKLAHTHNLNHMQEKENRFAAGLRKKEDDALFTLKIMPSFLSSSFCVEHCERAIVFFSFFFPMLSKSSACLSSLLF